MKLISRTISTMALLLMSLGTVTSAHAVGLAGFSPNDATFTNPGGAVVAIKGLPAWFQGQDGVTVKPCLDVAACVLVGAPDFNAALPLSYPTNFPSEAFYFNATNASIPVGTANALLVMALEYTFLDPLGQLVPASATSVGNPFQRLRLVHTFAGGGGVLPAAAAGGNFTVRTPWGTTIFPASSAKCVNSGGDTKCSMTRDLPLAGPNPTAALGATVVAPDSAINTFLRDPAAPAGFLGTGAAAASFVGAPAGHANSITITDPLGQTGTTTLLTTLTGMTIGLDVTPGNIIAMGPATIGVPAVPPVPKTVTVTNTTGHPILFPALVTAGANAADFAITSPSIVPVVAPAVALPGCSGATLTAVAPGNACSFDVTFTPAVGPTAARNATIAVAPTTVQPVPPVTPALPPPPPVTINLSGTAQYPLTVAVASSVTVPTNPGSGTLTSIPAGLKCDNLAAVAAAVALETPTVPLVTAPPVLCTASFDVGATVTLVPIATVTPVTLFDFWSGACTGIGACTVLMDGAKGVAAVPGPAAAALTADFVEAHNIVTSAAPAEGGTITATQVAKHGASPTITIALTPTATTRFRIGTVTDNTAPVTPIAVAGTNSFTYTIPAIDTNHTVAVNFVQQFAINTSVTNAGGLGGSITPTPLVDKGTDQKITITPDGGFNISSVLVDGLSKVVTTPAAPFDVPFTALSADHTVKVTFVRIRKIVTNFVGNGKVDQPATLQVNDGDTPSFKFTPSSPRFKIGKILVDNALQPLPAADAVTGTVTFALPAVTADKTVDATFVPSGDLDGNGKVELADVLLALRIFVRNQNPNNSDPNNTDDAAMRIGGLETVTIASQAPTFVPKGGAGAPVLNDIILILKKAVGAVTW